MLTGYILSKLPNDKEIVVEEMSVFKNMCKQWKLNDKEKFVYFFGMIQKYLTPWDLSLSNKFSESTCAETKYEMEIKPKRRDLKNNQKMLENEVVNSHKESVSFINLFFRHSTKKVI